MKDIRIGNDIKIAWSIFNEGVAFPLEGLNLHVYLKHRFGRREIDGILISGNKIEWTFYGREQRRTGVYSLELVINEGEDGMITTDACQFVNLVACTCKISGADDKGVRTETIELTSTLEFAGGGNYDDPEVKNELARLEREKADKSELTELSAEVSGLSEGIALRNVGAEDTDESVEEPDLPTPSASNEWKCVMDRRMVEGEQSLDFTTLADGTPLKAEELMVQILCDKQAEKTFSGYIVVHSTTNKTRSMYGSITIENNAVSETSQRLGRVYLKASPYTYMVAEIDPDIKNQTAVTIQRLTNGGNATSFQIYEDIVYVQLYLNAP